MTAVTLCFGSVFAFEPAGGCDVDCRAERLRDEMTGLAVLWCIPVLGLMLELQQRHTPPNTRSRPESTATNRPRISPLAHLHSPMVKAQAPRVMTFVHHKLGRDPHSSGCDALRPHRDLTHCRCRAAGRNAASLPRMY